MNVRQTQLRKISNDFVRRLPFLGPQDNVLNADSRSSHPRFTPAGIRRHDNVLFFDDGFHTSIVTRNSV